MFRSLAIVLVAGLLITVGAERWRQAGKSASAGGASGEAGSLLLEETVEVEASVGALEEPKLTNSPPNGLHVLEAHIRVHRPQEFLPATMDAPATVRAVKFPRAPFGVIPRRVTLYERPRLIVD